MNLLGRKVFPNPAVKVSVSEKPRLLANGTSIGPQIRQCDLGGLDHELQILGLPTPGKAEIHDALDIAVDVFGGLLARACADIRANLDLGHDDYLSLDPFFILFEKSDGAQRDSGRRGRAGVIAIKRPTHDLRLDALLDFGDEFRMSVEVLKSEWHARRLANR